MSAPEPERYLREPPHSRPQRPAAIATLLDAVPAEYPLLGALRG